MPTQLILAGGGIKSAVAAACCIKPDCSAVFLHVDYGQPSAIAEHRSLIALIPMFPRAILMKLPLSGLETLDRAVVRHDRPGVVHSPETGASAKPPAPLQPNPGLIPLLVSAAVYTAIKVGAGSIISGLSHVAPTEHLGLANGGGDSLRESLYALRVAGEALSPRGRPMTIETPLLDIAYPQIIKLAQRLQVPLQYTWSCAATQSTPCGTCPQCRLREAAFTEALELDPLLATAR